MKKIHNSGQMLVVVLLGLTMLAILIPALVNYVRNEAKWTIRDRRSTIAFHLAEAGIDRGIWKIKESTTTFHKALSGTVIPNYNFDKAFSDISGGVYRIRFSSGPGTKEVTVYAEGKDNLKSQFRAIKCVVKNQTIPGSIISGGVVTWKNDFQAHWGPIMSQDNIDIDATAAKDYFPRKYSKQVVTGSASNPRDTNGLTPPNTDGIEWWSDYTVPDLPVLDFPALRDAADKTSTLNLYGCNHSVTTGSGKSKKTTTYNNASWTSIKCNSNIPTPPNHNMHILNLDRHPDSKKGYTWYWDGDVAITGAAAADGCGLVGNIIVRGNLYLDCGDNYYFTGNVPPNAWMEYQKMDTSATTDYPADAGYHKNNLTFQHGNETWNSKVVPYYNTDVGIKGFIYVGGDLILNCIMDISGAIWVENNVTRLAGAGSDPVFVFYDDGLEVPTLNVVLVRQSWEETKPSTVSWP